MEALASAFAAGPHPAWAPSGNWDPQALRMHSSITEDLQGQNSGSGSHSSQGGTATPSDSAGDVHSQQGGERGAAGHAGAPRGRNSQRFGECLFYRVVGPCLLCHGNWGRGRPARTTNLRQPLAVAARRSQEQSA